MGRSDTESLRSSKEDFWSGKTVHFETRVVDDAEGIFFFLISLARYAGDCEWRVMLERGSC